MEFVNVESLSQMRIVKSLKNKLEMLMHIKMNEFRPNLN